MSSTELIPVDQVADILLNNADIGTVDEDAVQGEMVERILAAADLAEAFAGFESVPARDLEGRKLDVQGIAFMRSAYENGPKVYALLKCHVHDSKEDVVVSMGGRTLMASFVWAMRNRAMPITGTFVKRKSNANNERAYWTFNLA